MRCSGSSSEERSLPAPPRPPACRSPHPCPRWPSAPPIGGDAEPSRGLAPFHAVPRANSGGVFLCFCHLCHPFPEQKLVGLRVGVSFKHPETASPLSIRDPAKAPRAATLSATLKILPAVSISHSSHSFQPCRQSVGPASGSGRGSGGQQVPEAWAQGPGHTVGSGLPTQTEGRACPTQSEGTGM